MYRFHRDRLNINQSEGSSNVPVNESEDAGDEACIVNESGSTDDIGTRSTPVLSSQIL